MWLNSKVTKNAIFQYLMVISQYLFPMATFPYLTRVLGPDGYGIVTYLTGTMIYFQYIVDYGFTFSATKDIAVNRSNREAVENIIGTVTQAKLLLCLVALLLLSAIIPCIEVLRENVLTTYLYMCVVILSVFLPDYLFRGLEDMKIITIRFVIAKAVSTVLTFVLVHDKNDIVIIPILGILSSAIAILLTWLQIKKKFKYTVCFGTVSEIAMSFRKATPFFVSAFATTAFGAFNTFMLGIMPATKGELGYWGAYYGLVGSAQNLYTPIVNSLYPHMVSKRDYGLIRKVLKVFFPFVILAASITMIFANGIISILCGPEYTSKVEVFRILIMLLVISFPALILNFPVLGATGHVKETAKLTAICACFHAVGLLAMAILGCFTLSNVAILRNITEILLLCFILYYIWRKIAIPKNYPKQCKETI